MDQATTTSEQLLRRIDGATDAVRSLGERIADVEAVVGAVSATLARGGTLYTAGNGGSAAQALHLAEELVGRYRADRPPRRAVCLNADATSLTCIANDFGYDEVFSRPCRALLDDRDALLVLSTSGRSPNVLAALRAARERGAATLGLLGGDGGAALALCDHAVVVPSSDSAHVQEAHLVVVHLICERQEG
jgi:D-sedoheptulose 7-phosphate isomerase